MSSCGQAPGTSRTDDSDTNTVKSFDNSSHSHRSLDTSSAPDDLLSLGLKLGQDGEVESIGEFSKLLGVNIF